MSVPSIIREVFGRFHNLNLLALIHDLRFNETARQSWATVSLLCPVAHGLPAGTHVRELGALGQTASLDRGCDYAARHLGADPADVLCFVRWWDDQFLGRERLLCLLEALWHERMADATVMQQVLEAASTSVASFSSFRHGDLAAI